MSLNAEKVAEALALLPSDRAFLAHELIASLEEDRDANAEQEWGEELDNRTREIERSDVKLVPHEEIVAELRAKLHAYRRAS
jgi:hypothetical protein